MKNAPKRIGLAIVGAGRIGLIRGEIAARHGNVDWIGADFVTTDFRELLARPEVTAAIVATDEHLPSSRSSPRSSAGST